MSRAYVSIERLDAGTDDAVLATALDLVLRGLPDEVRRPFGEGIRLAARRNPDGLGELWRAVDRSNGATIGAVWSQLRPGGTAIVWPPQWTITAAGNEPDPLLKALLPVLMVRGTTLAQSLLVDRTVPEAKALESAGFRHLADLCYLAAPAAGAGSPTAAASQPALEFAPVDVAAWPRLTTVVEQTYDATLDCPALNGLRATAEVLDEYRTIGASKHELWRLVRSENQDVGCLLLADHPAQDQLELVYMGLLPSVRGRGFGEIVVREALRITTDCGRAQVVLAVDSANWPALAMYRRAGFTEFERRTVMTFAPSAATKKS